MSLPPRLILALVGVGLAGIVTVALATDHRGARIVASAGDAVIQGAAQAGFRVENVRLEGASPQSAADILRAASLTRGEPLFSLDLAGARGRVEQVGWVKSARIIRLFPDSVVIQVDERRLLAVWEHAGHVGVIDANGVVAPEADPGKFASLPLVVGDGANVAAAAILPLIQTRPRLLDRIDALVRVDDRRWDLRLKGGEIVQLPASDEEAALIRLDQLDQQSRILDLGFSRIDLRDPEMVAVRPRENPVANSGANEAG